jgi:hypothetical protein
MQARHHHPSNRDQRPPLRLNALDWAIYALVVVCTLGAWAFSCSSTPDRQQCMRHEAPRLLGILLQAGVLVLAAWTGSEIGRRRRSNSIGLACGIVLFFILSALLSWLGLSPGL